MVAPHDATPPDDSTQPVAAARADDHPLPKRPFGERTTPLPSVRVDSVQIEHVEEKAVRRWVRAHINEVRDCYRDALAILHGGVGGEVAIAWVIDRRGRVRTPRLLGATPELADVGNCIVARMARWRFPEPLWEFQRPSRNARAAITFRLAPP